MSEINKKFVDSNQDLNFLNNRLQRLIIVIFNKKKLYFKFLMIFMLTSYIIDINATVMPRVIGGEERIKIINYIPNSVFRYIGHYYY